MSCNTIYHTPGGDAPRSAGMWWGPLDIIPQISIFRELYDPKNVQIHLDTILKQKVMLKPGLHKLRYPGILNARKWRENEETR